MDAIFKWVKHHTEARLLHLPELLRLSRLCLLTLDYISNTLLKDGLLQSCPTSAEAVQSIYREVRKGLGFDLTLLKLLALL